MKKSTEKLDEKDRKILVELDKNARQTDSEIAKNTKTSKQVVNYHIQKLIEKEIISNFYTIIDTGLLGLNTFYVFIQLEKINKLQEQNILNKIMAQDFVGWLVDGVGRWDSVILIYADTLTTFSNCLNKIIEICGTHLHEYDFTTMIKSEHINYKFLGDKRVREILQKEKTTATKIDKEDKKLLSFISQNARASIVEISEKTRIPIHKAHYHLRKLIKQEIITGFKPKINVGKLGLQWHLLLIQFHGASEERREKFIDFCKQQRNIYYLTSTIGKYNLMLDIHVKDTAEFKEVLLELKENFSDLIKLYESLVIFDEYKIDYFPAKLIIT